MFVTGDFRHALSQNDDEEVADATVDFVLKLANSVDVFDSEHIHIVPGNHDLTRHTVDKRKITQIRKEYDVNNGTFPNNVTDLLLERFSFFKRVSKKLHSNSSVWTESLRPIHTYRCFDKYNLLYMNTAITCNDKNDRRKLVIGNNDLDNALEKIKDNGNPIIVLAHHSPRFFEAEEWDKVADMFEEYNVRLYLCGDSHKVGLRYISSKGVEVTMGCIKLEKSVQVAFSIGELLEDGSFKVQAHNWDSNMGRWGQYTQFNTKSEYMFNNIRNKDLEVDDRITTKGLTGIYLDRKKASIEKLLEPRETRTGIRVPHKIQFLVTSIDTLRDTKYFEQLKKCVTNKNTTIEISTLDPGLARDFMDHRNIGNMRTPKEHFGKMREALITFIEEFSNDDNVIIRTYKTYPDMLLFIVDDVCYVNHIHDGILARDYIHLKYNLTDAKAFQTRFEAISKAKGTEIMSKEKLSDLKAMTFEN